MAEGNAGTVHRRAGRGTRPTAGPGDGGDAVRPGSGVAASWPGDMGQPLLGFDRVILPPLNEAEARRLAIIQLRFAREVSQQAAIAYDNMVSVLTGSG